MKKWLIGFILTIGLLIGSLYIFIPNIVNLTAVFEVKATRAGLYRSLLDNSNVSKWWPGDIKQDGFYLNDAAYKIYNSNISVLPIYITEKNLNINSSLFLVANSLESTHLQWVAKMVTSYNPYKRFLAFLKAKSINNSMKLVLQKMQTFYGVSKNIYGFEIKKELVTDSFLIATNSKSIGYPSNEFVYNLVEKLKNYADINIAKQSGYPMLNVSTEDSINFDVKVAIPIDKLLPSVGDISQKRMLGRGNILVTEVTGGNTIAKKAFEQTVQYGNDYQRSSPAIPFYSLITNRLNQPDTSKWVTKIYFPVM
jgi:hypothetical protein